MNKHTPGEWRVTRKAGSNFLKIEAGKRLIGEVYPTNTGLSLDLPRAPHDANARLIAAAPELLEALTEKLPCTLSNTSLADDLETIAGAVDLAGYNVTAADLRQKARQIRAAVAKATGGTPTEADQQPLADDPMHQLANLDKPLTIGETLPATFAPTVLSQIMRERHAAGTCGWGCPECQAAGE